MTTWLGAIWLVVAWGSILWIVWGEVADSIAEEQRRIATLARLWRARSIWRLL